MRDMASAADDLRAAESDLSRFFKALADDTRRAILVLLERRERNVTEIVERFSLTQPTISRHLQVLREARLVRCERRGQHVVYSLDQENLAQAAGSFFGRFGSCRRTTFDRGLNSFSSESGLATVDAHLARRLRIPG